MPSRSSVPSVETLRPKGSPLPGFLTPADEPMSPASPSDLPSPVTTDPEWGSPQLEADGLDETVASDVPTSSAPSSRTSSLPKARVQEAARKAVMMTGEGAHRLLSRDEFDEQVDLYRADADDAEAIGDPVGSIVHRHGLLGDAANPDVVDGINALVGLAVYGWKQVERRREARRLRRLQREAEDAGTEQAAEAAGGPYGAL